jgi:hypothetical protein
VLDEEAVLDEVVLDEEIVLDERIVVEVVEAGTTTVVKVLDTEVLVAVRLDEEADGPPTSSAAYVEFM